jgi:protein TonB
MLLLRAILGALILTGLLLVAAARLVQERPQRQDITAPVPVSLVTVPREEAPPEEQRLPLPSLTAPPLDGPAVVLDPGLFGEVAPVGAMVFDARDLDTPPRGIEQQKPVYPYKARQRRIEGVVEVRFLVRADGTVGEIIIESAEPEGVFEDAVREAVSRWRFEPGKLAGESVAAWVKQPLRFDAGGGWR